MSHFCRYCRAPLTQTLIDLGATPLANAYLPSDDPVALAAEQRFPLHVVVCNDCWLVQTTETVAAEQIFSHNYAYLSSYSAGWVEHARRYATEMIARFGLGPSSEVIEVASNDGYLLQHFVHAGIPVLGIEPAGHAAELAEAKGVRTRVVFFDESTAADLLAEGHGADLMVANNVLAHVPDIRRFVAGFRVLLKPDGVATFEFPHLASLLDQVQFDTIYHEHYSYLSFTFVERLMREAGLEVFDVARLPTHGGSLRLFAGRVGAHYVGTAVADLRAQEAGAGLASPMGYVGMADKVAAIVRDFRSFLIRSKALNKTVAAYGAAAKGNTFLNFAGITSADIPFVVDRNSEKQGKLLPGSHIPVLSPDEIARQRPDYLVILPWNIAGEIMQEQKLIREWGGQFVTAVPELAIR